MVNREEERGKLNKGREEREELLRSRGEKEKKKGATEWPVKRHFIHERLSRLLGADIKLPRRGVASSSLWKLAAFGLPWRPRSSVSSSSPRRLVPSSLLACKYQARNSRSVRVPTPFTLYDFFRSSTSRLVPLSLSSSFTLFAAGTGSGKWSRLMLKHLAGGISRTLVFHETLRGYSVI